MQDVEPGQDVFGLVHVASGQPVDEGSTVPARLGGARHQRIAGRRQTQRRVAGGKMDDQDSAFDRRDASGAELGVEAVGQVVPDGPGMHAADSTESRGRAAPW